MHATRALCLALLVLLPTAAAFTARVGCTEEASALLECRNTRWDASFDAFRLMEDGDAAHTPDGRTLVLAGVTSLFDGRVVALDAGSGATRWTTDLGTTRAPRALALSDARAFALYETALVALDVATGAEAWRVHAGEMRDLALVGDRVVLGSADVLAAYDAETGALQWSRPDRVAALAADGALVHAATARGTEERLVSVDVATGALVDDRVPGIDDPAQVLAQDGRVAIVGGTDLAIHDGAGARVVPLPLSGTRDATLHDGRAYVTGYGAGGYVTVAIDLALGVTAWTAVYAGYAGVCNYPTDVEVTPDGQHVLVTGYSLGPTFSEDVVTLSYAPPTGAVEWTAREVLPGSDLWPDLAVAPTGGLVTVTGDGHGEPDRVHARTYVV